MGDRFDQVLVDRDEIGPILVVDDDIGQADKEPLFLIDGIRDPVPHRWDQEISHVSAIHRPNADANFFTFWHGSLRPYVGISSALAAQELLAPAQFFILMFAHFLSALLQDARHTTSLVRAGV